MIIIEVKGSIEKSLKKYKRKFENLKIGKQLRDRKHFKKRSIDRREGINKAKYVEQKFKNND